MSVLGEGSQARGGQVIQSEHYTTPTILTLSSSEHYTTPTILTLSSREQQRHSTPPLSEDHIGNIETCRVQQ